MPENKDIAFQAVKVVGRSAEENEDEEGRGSDEEDGFVIDAQLAKKMLADTSNPNGRSNSDVVRPYLSGDEVIGRARAICDRFWNEHERGGCSGVCRAVCPCSPTRSLSPPAKSRR